MNIQIINGLIKVDKALDHPQTLPFLGVSREEARVYLKKHKQVYGPDIGIWHCDDLGEEPVARPLLIGFASKGIFDGANNLDNGGHVLGERCRVSVDVEKEVQNISRIVSLEEVLTERKKS
mgnify:FL=1